MKHAWTNIHWYQFQYKLPAGPLPSNGLWSMARMKKQNEKHEKVNMLAKSKTRKGGLGKNEHPDGLTTFKGNSGKNRGMWKEFISRWIENPKGRSRQKWDEKKRKKRKSKHAKSIDHRCDIQSALDSRASSNSSTIKRSYFLQVYERDLTPCPQQWSWCVFKRRHPPEEELLQVYVRTRAITCPIFQCLVCLCEVMSANCQSSCISKHSYIHDHASYVLIHLIKLLCYSYAFAFSIPILISVKINHVNFKFNQSCQFQIQSIMSISNSINHANFKIQQSCRLQALAVLSNSSSCIHVKSISICFYDTICFC